MTARDMLEYCKINQTRFLNIAAITEPESRKMECLYDALFYGNMVELLEDYIYDNGRHIDFLFKCFELREKDFFAALQPKPFAAREAEAQSEKPK